MNISKSISTLGLGVAVVAGSMLAVTTASAYGGSEEKQAERVSELAERFDLNEEEVQTYFVEKQEERQAERQEKSAERLATLVEEGTLTQAQADKLAELQEEFKSAAEALRDSDAEREEMKALMEKNQAELKSWAESEGLNIDDIRPEHEDGKRGHHGPRD